MKRKVKVEQKPKRKLSIEVPVFRPRVPINVTISPENADYLERLEKGGRKPSHVVDHALTMAREMEIDMAAQPEPEKA